MKKVNQITEERNVYFCADLKEVSELIRKITFENEVSIKVNKTKFSDEFCVVVTHTIYKIID